MSYLGVEPKYGDFKKQNITADDATVTFTLDYTVVQASSLVINYGDTILEPVTDYTVSGTSITFTFTPASVVSPFYVIFLGRAYEVATLSDGSLVSDTTPKLGGNLDVNGNSITDSVASTVNVNVAFTVGTPTGGSQGSGTINAEAVYVNGQDVSTSGGVNSMVMSTVFPKGLI